MIRGLLYFSTVFTSLDEKFHLVGATLGSFFSIKFFRAVVRTVECEKKLGRPISDKVMKNRLHSATQFVDF
jgi:hypothetical protein